VPFALLVAALSWRKRMPSLLHAVFALHFYAFLLLLMCVASVALALDRLLSGSRLESPFFDHALSIGVLAACMVYLSFALARVYRLARWTLWSTTIALTCAVAAIFMGYRFILLPITLWTT
jgi:hypothetical protein